MRMSHQQHGPGAHCRPCACAAGEITIPSPSPPPCAPPCMLSAVAGPEANLSVFKGTALTVVPANETLTFEHSYAWWGE
jgi:hypothetical protein